MKTEVYRCCSDSPEMPQKEVTRMHSDEFPEAQFRRNPKPHLAVFCTVLFSLLAFAKLNAQVTTADIVGTVTDPGGAAVPNGTATVTNIATGQIQTTHVSNEGAFTFTLLQVGTYKVTVQAAGFKGYATQVTLAVGDRARIKKHPAQPPPQTAAHTPPSNTPPRIPQNPTPNTRTRYIHRNAFNLF